MEQEAAGPFNDVWHSVSPAVQVQHLVQALASDMPEHGFQVPLSVEEADQGHGDPAQAAGEYRERGEERM